MIKSIKKHLLIFSVMLLGISSVAKANYSDTTHLFGDIAIQEVRHSASNGSLSFQAIEIREVLSQANNTKQPAVFRSSEQAVTLGQTYWVIDADSLPVSQDICDKAEVENCQWLAKVDSSSAKVCHGSCVMYGPEFLAYDKNHNTLYLKNQLGDGGNAGWQLGIFKADVKSHQINLMRVIMGPLNAALSSDGLYLTLNSIDQIDVLNTEENKIVSTYAVPYSDAEDHLNEIYDVKWISSTAFVFTESVFKDKFASKPMSAFQKTFDVQKNKIVAVKQLSENNVGSK